MTDYGFPGCSDGKEFPWNARDPGWEDLLEKGMATHSSILAWNSMDRGAWQWGCKESDMTEPLTLWLSYQITMLWWSQVDSKGTQEYMYSILPQNPSHPGCRVTLNRVQCAICGTLLVMHFKHSTVYMSIPNSLTIPSLHPSPLVTITSFFKSPSTQQLLSSYYWQ